MKKSKILAPALGVLVLSTAASISGTVAWFTANNSVQVTGMSVKTRVGSNLLIADRSTANASDDVYGTELEQEKEDLYLEPVSTVDGETFFYHSAAGVHGDGSQTGNTFIEYEENGHVGKYPNVYDNNALNAIEDMENGDIAHILDHGYYKYNGTSWDSYELDFGDPDKEYIDVNFNNTYSFNHLNEANSCFGYIDYNFYLRAFSSTDDQILSLTKCNLLRDGAALTANSATDFAWRVAVLSEAVDEGDATGEGQSLVSILKHSGGAYFTNGKAAASTSSIDDVEELGQDVVIANNLDAGDIARYRVTVRLWLEGEDQSCNNETYAALSTSDWTLDLEFELGTAPVAVAAIGSVAA